MSSTVAWTPHSPAAAMGTGTRTPTIPRAAAPAPAPAPAPALAQGQGRGRGQGALRVLFSLGSGDLSRESYPPGLMYRGQASACNRSW